MDRRQSKGNVALVLGEELKEMEVKLQNWLLEEAAKSPSLEIFKNPSESLI